MNEKKVTVCYFLEGRWVSQNTCLILYFIMRVLREQRDLSSEEGKAALFTPLNTGSGAHGGVGVCAVDP